MENCYKMYAWLCRTVVTVMLEMFWKMRQISDYFGKVDSEENSKIFPLASEMTPPLTKESKQRRHIRSMSDVLNSTPLHKIPVKTIRRISQPIIYDSDSRTRRLRLRNRYQFDSSDSHSESPDWKPKTLEINLKKYTTSADSMRYL